MRRRRGLGAADAAGCALPRSRVASGRALRRSTSHLDHRAPHPRHTERGGGVDAGDATTLLCTTEGRTSPPCYAHLRRFTPLRALARTTDARDLARRSNAGGKAP